MATIRLTHKHRKFAREFAECLDIEVAAARAGLRANEAADTLAKNDALELLVRQIIARQRLAADYADPEALRMRLYQLALSSENETTRIRAAALYFETAGGTKQSNREAVEEKFAEVAALLTNARESDTMARDVRTDANTATDADAGHRSTSGAVNGGAGGSGKIPHTAE